jgi:hypothetical protein
MTDHLSEAAIQQYALDGDNCPAWMGQHLHGCEECRVRVSNYRVVFEEVEAMQAVPVKVDIEAIMVRLNGDLSGEYAVQTSRMALPVRRRDRSMAFWLTAVVLGMIGGAWAFRASLLKIAGDIPITVLCVLAGISVVIAVAHALRLVAQYRHQIKKLTLS